MNAPSEKKIEKDEEEVERKKLNKLLHMCLERATGVI